MRARLAVSSGRRRDRARRLRRRPSHRRSRPVRWPSGSPRPTRRWCGAHATARPSRPVRARARKRWPRCVRPIYRLDDRLGRRPAAPGRAAGLGAPDPGCERATPPCAPFAGVREQLRAVRSAQRAQRGGWQVVVDFLYTPGVGRRGPGGLRARPGRPHLAPDRARGAARVPRAWSACWPSWAAPRASSCATGAPGTSPTTAASPRPSALVRGGVGRRRARLLRRARAPAAHGAGRRAGPPRRAARRGLRRCGLGAQGDVRRGLRAGPAPRRRVLERPVGPARLRRGPGHRARRGGGARRARLRSPPPRLDHRDRRRRRAPGGPRPTDPASLRAQCREMDGLLARWHRDPRVQAAFQYTLPGGRPVPGRPGRSRRSRASISHMTRGPHGRAAPSRRPAARAAGDLPRMSELARALAFVHGLAERAVTEVTRDGPLTVLRTPDLPLVWDANHLRVEGAAGADARALAASRRPARRTVDGRGARRGRGRAARPGFRALGWRVVRHSYMAHRGEPPAVEGVGEAEIGAVEPARRDLIVAEQWGTREVAEQVLAFERRLGAAAASDRWFTAPPAGRSPRAAACSRATGSARSRTSAPPPPSAGRGSRARSWRRPSPHRAGPATSSPSSTATRTAGCRTSTPASGSSRRGRAQFP